MSETMVYCLKRKSVLKFEYYGDNPCVGVTTYRFCECKDGSDTTSTILWTDSYPIHLSFTPDGDYLFVLLTSSSIVRLFVPSPNESTTLVQEGHLLLPMEGAWFMSAMSKDDLFLSSSLYFFRINFDTGTVSLTIDMPREFPEFGLSIHSFVASKVASESDNAIESDVFLVVAKVATSTKEDGFVRFYIGKPYTPKLIVTPNGRLFEYHLGPILDQDHVLLYSSWCWMVLTNELDVQFILDDKLYKRHQLVCEDQDWCSFGYQVNPNERRVIYYRKKCFVEENISRGCQDVLYKVLVELVASYVGYQMCLPTDSAPVSRNRRTTPIP